MDRREIGGHVTQELTKIVFEIRERTTSQFFTVKHPVPDVPDGLASHHPNSYASICGQLVYSLRLETSKTCVDAQVIRVTQLSSTRA